jgi:glycine cleavage system H lipoate-binding protein/ABC-type phosphate transport system substrate-binding protein
MKNLFYIIAGLMVILTGMDSQRLNAANPQGAENGNASSLQIVSTPELMELSVRWADAYQAAHPAVKINVTEAGENALLAPGHISLLNSGMADRIAGQDAWSMAIGRDAVVAIVNSGNPLLAEIRKQGITPEKLASLLTGGNWTIFENVTSGNPVSVTISQTTPVTAQLEAYTRTDASAMKFNEVSGTTELLKAVHGNVYGIGFCRLTDIIGPDGKTFAAGIGILPVDRNRNGRIDQFENIYNTPEAFVRGIWTGKYPATLTDNIFAAAPVQPESQAAVAFLSWVSTQGQDLLGTYGFADLSTSEKQANLQMLSPAPLEAELTATGIPGSTWAKILIALALAGLAVYGIILYRRSHRLIATAEGFRMSEALNPESIKAPAGLYYDKSHTWAFMEKDGTVRIGIDDFMQHITGPLTRIRMKQPGEKVRKGEKMVTLIKEGKQLELYAPVTGTIRMCNEDLLGETAIINQSPYTEGWVYTIEPTNWARETQFMFPGSDYRQWLSEEFARLRDFFALTVNQNNMVYQHVVLQDGGEITDQVLADLGPEVWEEFQNKFIDTSR